MQPIVVFPFHDPEKVTFSHLLEVTPSLKETFSGAYVGVTHLTYGCCQEQIGALGKDPFFKISRLPDEGLIGDQFLALYRWVANIAQPEQVLHLAYIDRLAFIMQSDYRRQFIEDVSAVQGEDTPLIFTRSEKAWATHPQNYYEIERMVTTASLILFRKEIDFAWCHLVLRVEQLQKVLPLVRNHDLSMVAEMVLPFKDLVRQKEVDWLAWEDPFIYTRDPKELKEDREQSQKEAQKRLSYVIPMLQLLVEAARKGS